VRKTEKLGERERKALFPSKGKGIDDDDACRRKESWFYISE